VISCHQGILWSSTAFRDQTFSEGSIRDSVKTKKVIVISCHQGILWSSTAFRDHTFSEGSIRDSVKTKKVIVISCHQGILWSSTTFRNHTFSEGRRDFLADFTHYIFQSLTSARCCNYSYMCS